MRSSRRLHAVIFVMSIILPTTFVFVQALIVCLLTDDRIEVNENGERIAWFALDSRGEPYAFGAHDDDVGAICGPWKFEKDGVHHPIWVSRPDGAWRASLDAKMFSAIGGRSVWAHLKNTINESWPSYQRRSPASNASGSGPMFPVPSRTQGRTGPAVTVNGRIHQIDADDDMPLLWILRDLIGLTGTK